MPSENVLKVTDIRDLKIGDTLRELRRIIRNHANEEIVLDLRLLESVHFDFLLPLCAYVMAQRNKGLRIKLLPPKNYKLADLLWNANLAHFFDPDNFSRRDHYRQQHVPFLSFHDHESQNQVVSLLMDRFISEVSLSDKAQIYSLEWCLAEITDNVISHAQSVVGGLAGLAINRDKKMASLYVVDAGLGVAKTLRTAHAGFTSDNEALCESIKEGVTRNPVTNVGNGLFGSYRCAVSSKGQFRMISNGALLSYSGGKLTPISQTKSPFDGTFLRLTIGYDDADQLRKALSFGGKVHVPLDLIDRQYFADGDQGILDASREAVGFRNRTHGRMFRTKLENLLIEPHSKLALDFSGVELISSSFADEVFGLLAAAMGHETFLNRISVFQANPTIIGLIDRAIVQRLRMQPRRLDS